MNIIALSRDRPYRVSPNTCLNPVTTRRPVSLSSQYGGR